MLKHVYMQLGQCSRHSDKCMAINTIIIGGQGVTRAKYMFMTNEERENILCCLQHVGVFKLSHTKHGMHSNTVFN